MERTGFSFILEIYVFVIEIRGVEVLAIGTVLQTVHFMSFLIIEVNRWFDDKFFPREDILYRVKITPFFFGIADSRSPERITSQNSLYVLVFDLSLQKPFRQIVEIAIFLNNYTGVQDIRLGIN